MSSVGFCAKTQQTIFGIISAVLLLGNITYIKVNDWDGLDSKRNTTQKLTTE